LGTTPGGHVPVLPREVCRLLAVDAGQIVVDATVGLGGHAALFAERVGPSGTLIGLDADPRNLDVARTRLAGFSGRLELVHANFRELRSVLSELAVELADVLFADLGVVSTQLDDGARGFSFQNDGPLDMRMDPRLETTAAELVNRLKEKELGDLIWQNGQESGSRRIARRICEARREGRITSTIVLARLVAEALHVDPTSRFSKIHPATRTFMALRMAVNEELRSLEELLSLAPSVLKPGGRFGMISFHSLEDKPVKLDFRKRKAEGVYEVATPKPIVADDEERDANPRSRSAKFRVAIRR